MRPVLGLTLLVQTALFAVRPMVSYRALDLGADAVALGVVAASFSVLSLLVAVPIGRWVDRRGERGAVVCGTLLMGVVSLVLVVVDSVALLAVTQAALGCGHIMNVVGIQSWIANHSGPGPADRAFAHFTVTVSIGQLVGPAAAGLLAGPVGARVLTAVAASGGGDHEAVSLVFAAFGLVCLAGVPWAAGLPSTRSAGGGGAGGSGAGRMPLLAILRVPSMPQALLVSLTVLTAVDLLTVYLPAYGVARGLGVEVVGLLLAVRAAASLASRLVMGRLVDRFGRGRVLLWSTAGPVLPLLLLPLTDDLALLFAAMVVIGFGLGMGQPLTLAWVAGRVSVDTRGAALGLRLSVNRLSQVVLPVAIGAVAGALGVAAIFPAVALLLGVSAGAAHAASFGPPREGPPGLRAG